MPIVEGGLAEYQVNYDCIEAGGPDILQVVSGIRIRERRNRFLVVTRL
jgi:hypothetical protein